MNDLRFLFEYDLWATRRWLPLCEQPELRSVMSHILGAQAIWLSRLSGSVPPELDDLNRQALEQNEAFQAHLATADLSEVVRYTNSRGQSFQEPRGLIARHVINHGTYHRGQMRAIAERLGLEFPETDLIVFLREARPDSVI